MKTPTTDRYKYRRTPCAKQREEDTGWHALAAAIVRQAVEDYREADMNLKNVPNFARKGDREKYIWHWQREKYRIVKFFKSQWYGTLCDIDPNLILKKLGAIK